MKIRRRQLHEKRVQGRRSWWVRCLRTATRWSVGTTIVFAAGVSLIALSGDASLRYSIGQRVDQPVRARAAFSVADPARTIADQETARALAPSHFVLSAAHVNRIIDELRAFHRAATEAASIEAYREAARPEWPTEETVFEHMRAADGDFDAALRRLREALDREYILEGSDDAARVPPSRSDVIIVHLGDDDAQPPRRVARTDLTSLASVRQIEGRASALALAFPAGMREPVRSLLATLLKQSPTIVYDAERTRRAMERAAGSVPEARTAFARNQQFLTPHPVGQNPGLTAREQELLQAEQRAYETFLRSGTPEARTALTRERLRRVGTITLITFLSIALFVYVAQHQPRILENRARTVAFAGLILAMLAVASALDARWVSQVPQLVLAPCIFAGSVLAVVYPRRFAMGSICIAGVLTTLVLRRDLVFAMVLLTGVVVNGFQLDDIRTRTKIVVAGLITGCAVALASFAGSLALQESLTFARDHAVHAFITSCGAVLVYWAALPFIEKVFGIATPLTLLEWSESRQPLLQLLANEAPGTHQHSLTLSKLVDAACNAIGANGLLASVGALYHDIGKIPKAQYFVENQQAMINRHQHLAPTMSLLIIVAHVKDGVEMAKEYKLPRVLFQFIREHHGTTVVKYFHHVAAEKQPEIASGRHDREVSEAEFRYQGPKPRSRESAVLMLCDGVEGAVRALREPTPGRIETVVHQIVMDRLNDGQFDDCDITLSQVHRAEEALVKTLGSLYHGRVAYPESRKGADRAAETEEGKVRKAQ